MGQLFQFISSQALVESSQDSAHNSSHDGGNGGGDDMLEPRVARLEANVAHIASDVTDIKADLRLSMADLSTLKVDLALAKRDVSDIKSDTGLLKTDFKTITSRLDGVEESIRSFKTTVKASAAVISLALVVFGFIAGPYLAKIATILNALALKS